MQKNQTFKTPTRNSPQKKLKQNLSQTQSQFKSQANSTYMSKQLSTAHSSIPLKCSNQSHQSQNVQYICLKNDCDKPYRLACMQCMKGHHNDHVNEMIKLSEFLHNENKETLPFEVPNWPRNQIGNEIKDYIQSEEQYIQGLYDGIDNVFNEFMQKVQLEVNKMKQNMQSDVANYYKKGPGKKKIDFINQLKFQYIDSYNLTDLQSSIKDLMNRGIQLDIFDTKVEYFLNSHQTQQSRENTNKFFLNRKVDNKFEMDFSLLQDLQKQITEQIYKCRKISNTSKKFDIPKTQNTDFKPWSENFHTILNYLNQQYKNLSDKDIVQYKQEVYADGSKYEGFFVNGQRDIIGSRFHVDGNNYFGEFSQGQKSGNGLIYYYKGNIYEGTFFNDKRDGYGKEIYTSGAKYEGEFSNDMKHGNGKYTFNDGRVFQGIYQNDKREGLGVIIYLDGRIEEVMYQQGERVYAQQYNQMIDMSNQQTSQFPQNTSDVNQDNQQPNNI